MKERIKEFCLMGFLICFMLFTAICDGSGWILSRYRYLVVQIWYQGSVMIWLSMAVTAVYFRINFQKLMVLQNKIDLQRRH